jgi:hypothetical protein
MVLMAASEAHEEAAATSSRKYQAKYESRKCD